MDDVGPLVFSLGFHDWRDGLIAGLGSLAVIGMAVFILEWRR